MNLRIDCKMMKPQYSDSDSEQSSSSISGRFRVRVCMTRFFSDERARALVCVSARRRVRWLQRRLQALFALPERCVLLCQGHMLPPAEPLAILHRDDVVDVIPPRADVRSDCKLVGDDGITSCIIAAPESRLRDPDCDTPTRVDRDEYSAPTTPLLQPDVTDSAKRSLVALSNDEDELRQRKRSALLMLEQVCGEQGDVRPRRRRVRRRRRTAAAALAAADAGDESDGRATPRRELSRDESVLRNGHDRSRAPRVIRAFDDRSL